MHLSETSLEEVTNIEDHGYVFFLILPVYT
jgi:hypothetical protein